MFVCFLLGSAVAYNIVMIIYRLYFHKLSRFPGPRLAAATGLYEIYFSAWGPGIFEYEIDNMHRKFGMPSNIYKKKGIESDPFQVLLFVLLPMRSTSKSRSGLPAIPIAGSKVPENWNLVIIKVAASIVSSTRGRQSPEHDLCFG